MKKTNVSVLEEQFKQECEVINLKYEYSGYTGTEKYGIITNLTEKELYEKYESLISGYEPFLILNSGFSKVRDEFRRNEDKHLKRSKNYGDVFAFDDGVTEIYHAELLTEDCSVAFIRREWLKDGIDRLKSPQRERLIKFFFWGYNASQIAKEEGVSSQAVDKSLSAAIENLKKFLV